MCVWNNETLFQDLHYVYITSAERVHVRTVTREDFKCGFLSTSVTVVSDDRVFVSLDFSCQSGDRL